MSYLVLARKCRPQTFDEILGQEAVVKTIKNAIGQDRLAHAFLFSGPRGVGKTSLARVLAKALNCMSFDGPTTTPCGTCSACRDIAAGSSVDVLEIDGASNRGIDNIRELRETVRYLPASYRTKVYIIDEVHMLTTESFNALLKTLEEPPSHVVFMFATTEPHKVPATILSRCQRYDFHRVGMSVLVDNLRSICEREGIELPEGALRVIAREAEGGVRDSLSLLDQVAGFGAKGLTEEDVLKILGVVDRTLVAGLARATLGRDPASVIELLASSGDSGRDAKRLAREMLRFFRNLVVVKLTRDPERLIDASDQELEDMRSLAEEHSIETVERLFDRLARFEDEVSSAGSPGLLLEMTLVKMATLPPLAPLADLIARLEEIETEIKSGSFSGGGGTGGGTSGQREPECAGNDAKEPLFEGGRLCEDHPEKEEAREDDAERWADFLDHVRKREPKLYAFLQAGSFSGRSGREWRLVFAPGSPAMERLKGERNSKRLMELVVESLGNSNRLIVNEDQGLASPSSSHSKRWDEDERRKEAIDDPVVKALMEKLSGDLEEVKLK